MIHYVSGDILLSRCQAIAHGVAPNDHFDQGLALALREKWPSMARDYKHYTHQTHPNQGELWCWGGVGGVRIYNLITQQGDFNAGSKPGRATVSNVNHCLKRLRHELDKGEITSIALPKLATGIGALEWDDVKALIEQHLGDCKIPVYVYSTYHQGVQAKEADVA